MPSEQTRSSAEETQKARKRDVSEAAEKALVVAQQVGEGLKSGVAKGASGVKKGIASAQARMDAQEHAWDARSARSDMPEISREAPLLDLATRLDKQADFFRELAIDATRPTLSRHVLHALLVMLAALSATLSAGLAWQVITGNEHTTFVASAVVDAGAALMALGLGLWLERSRLVLAREAFAHAARAEETLEKIAGRLAATDEA
jgi:hypothetical protein